MTDEISKVIVYVNGEEKDDFTRLGKDILAQVSVGDSLMIVADPVADKAPTRFVVAEKGYTDNTSTVAMLQINLVKAINNTRK